MNTPGLKPQPNKRPPSLRALLSGGDRRSLAQSSRALALIRADPERLWEIAKLAEDKDWLISMRALDLLEKLAHEHPDWVESHKQLFIGALADSNKWEIRLQIARALPFFDWTRLERRRVIDILRRDVKHPQKFVKVWALDSLAAFARNDVTLMPVVHRCLQEFGQSGSPALMARARQIWQRLSAQSR